MTLNKEQIAQLYLFVEEKRVLWYDLQTELVDHLANKIEEEWEQNPSYTFDSALQKVYVSFGIFGFARIVREKEEQVRKQNNKLWKQEFKNQFVWPNLIRSIALLLVMGTLIKNIDIEYIYLVGFITLIAHFIKRIIITRRQMKLNKKLLITQYEFFPYYLGLVYWQLFIQSFDFENGFNPIQNEYILFGLFYIVTLSYLASIKMASNINKKAKVLFPEAFEIVK